jgi:hypothetical protein
MARKKKVTAGEDRQIGFLIGPKRSDWAPYIKAFEKRLKDLGRTDAVITYLPPAGARGKPDVLKTNAEYLAENTEVIVTSGTAAALACKAATAAKMKPPFIFAAAGDPDNSGLKWQKGAVNFTGGRNQQITWVKARVAAMLNSPAKFEGDFAVVGNDDVAPVAAAMAQAVTELMKEGKTAKAFSLKPGDPIDTFVEDRRKEGYKSFYVCSELYLTSIAKDLNKFAHDTSAGKAKIQTMFEIAELKKSQDGDESLGVDFEAMFETAAEYADQILKGKTIDDLPPFDGTLRKRSKRRRRRSSARKKR